MAVQVKTTRGARQAAIERIISGASTDKDEARKLRVHIGRVRAWVTMAKRAKANEERPPDAPPLDPFGSSRDDSTDPSPDLERARKSAGGEEEPAETLGGSTPSDGTSSPALSADQVVALASVTRAQLLKFYAGTVRLDPEDPRVRAAFTMSSEEKATLAIFAPAIAGRVQELLGTDGSTAGAFGFAIVFVLGTWNGMATLRGLSKAERARSPSFVSPPRDQASASAEPPSASSGAEAPPTSPPKTSTQLPDALASIY